MEDFSLIANTGIHMLTFPLEIDPQQKFKLWFHEWYDKTVGEWKLSLAEQVAFETGLVFYDKKKLCDYGYINFANIAKECAERKGISVVGIIDCASPYVIEDIENFLATGEAYEIADGGIIYKDKVCIILGSEIETSEINDQGKTGSAHNLCYFPSLKDIKAFSKACEALGLKNVIGKKMNFSVASSSDAVKEFVNRTSSEAHKAGNQVLKSILQAGKKTN